MPCQFRLEIWGQDPHHSSKSYSRIHHCSSAMVPDWLVFDQGALVEGIRAAGYQTCNQNHLRSMWPVTPAPRTDATALPSMRHTGCRLRADCVVRPVDRQDSSATPEHSAEHLADPYPSALRTVATTVLEVEAHILPTHLRVRHQAQRTRQSSHATSGTPDLERTHTGPET